MAIWQHELLFIPRERVIRELGALDARMPAEQWDATHWWSEHQPPSDFQSRIGAILPAYDSWSPEILMWGSEDSDRIHVCLDDARQHVEEVSIRLDLRHPCQRFARAIADLAQHADCVCATWPHRTFEPTFDHLMTEIAASESARYVRAPREYFEELVRDPNKESRGWKFT
jgi:hypothetical protein